MQFEEDFNADEPSRSEHLSGLPHPHDEAMQIESSDNSSGSTQGPSLSASVVAVATSNMRGSSVGLLG